METKKEKFLLAILFFMLMIMVGATLNFVVIKNNDCLMPVYSNYIYEGDKSHFPFKKFDEVSYPYLSDIMSYKSGTKIHIFSIGDLIMVVGMAGSIISSFLYLRIKKREGRHVENVD